MVDIFEKKYGRGIAKRGVGVTLPYSEEYKKFRRSESKRSHKFYEGICNLSAKIYSPKLKPEKQQQLQSTLDAIHLETTPEGVTSLSYLASLLVLLATAGIAIGFFKTTPEGVTFNIYALILPFILAPLMLYVLPKIPNKLLQRWQASASDQIVLAVLYIIISMKRESNLEQAIYFAAKHLRAPLSLDFMKVLWDFQAGKYSTVTESLDNYLMIWKKKEDAFIDAMNLIESSLHSSKQKADRLLDKAVDVVLTGVQDHMTHFAHSIQGPIRALYMLGVVLPILMLVMLPLAGSFLGIGAMPIILVFNVFIPLGVYLIARHILGLRPGGINKTSKELYMHKLAGRKALAVFTFLAVAGGAVGVFAYHMIGGTVKYGAEGFKNMILFDPAVGNITFTFSILAVAGVGIGLALYYWISIGNAIKLKRKVNEIENQFSSAAFQLGSRIDEGTPTELAFSKVAEVNKGTSVGELFATVNYNMRTKGMSLMRAIFDKNSGAAYLFPSDLIKSVFRVLVESAKKSLKVVAHSLLVLSRYLKDMHRVNERLQDLLSDTISSMRMQASALVAIITGTIVALSVLIVKVLVQLSQTIQKLSISETGSLSQGAPGATSQTGFSSGLLNLFNPTEAIAPYMFQLVIGAYVIIIVILLSYLLARVVHGNDELERKYLTAKNLFYSTIIYVLITFIGSRLLSGLAEKVALGVS